MNWFRSTYRVWRREFRLVFSDVGVLIFFFALPTLYPIAYTLIYNPEVAREIPIVVVDHDASAKSRDFVRAVNRTETINVIGYATDLEDAREAMNEHQCYGILEIPSDYAECLGRGEQATVPFYTEMSLLIRYRQFMFALTDVQLYESTAISARKIAEMGAEGATLASTMMPTASVESYLLGDTTQGFASFVMPGVLVLIIQQSIIIGIAMLAGGAAERRRRNNGYDPMFPDESPSAMLFGKLMCYMTFYIPMLYFTLHIVPYIFSLPSLGTFTDTLLLMTPMIAASAMLGMCLGVFVTERETSFLIVVASSILVLFLSGLTWPTYAMVPFWGLVSGCIPASWGVRSFISMNSLGAPFALQAHNYIMMWVLTAAYGLVAYILTAYRRKRNRALAPKAAEA